MSFKTNENPLCGFHSKSQSKLEAAFFFKRTHQAIIKHCYRHSHATNLICKEMDKMAIVLFDNR